nr:peptide-methionine (S)-S-oxide reductase MsrA [Chloroherpeton thalassium]
MSDSLSVNESKSGLDTATFGAGCFWCVEAVFQRVNGVLSVVSGYAGGEVEKPTYEQVCSGATGHAEVAQITFNPNEVSYEELLEIFWHTHNPTTLNRQGNDEGTQYRSVIFYHSNEQKKIAEASKAKANASGEWREPIVTEIVPYTKFFKAESYHQNYYNQHLYQPYCSFVISPKLEKFKSKFSDKLKDVKK